MQLNRGVIVWGACDGSETGGQVVAVFYGTLFRKTMQSAKLEAVKARGFVSKMPTYTLAKEETDVIRGFFQLPGHGSE